jgi:hypothetical protein
MKFLRFTRTAIASALAIGMVAGTVALSSPASAASASNNPRGYIDGISVPAPGKLDVGGWAYDPDAPTTPVAIHVYVGGPAGTPGAVGYNLGAANGSRPDVAQAIAGIGAQHGFGSTIATSMSGTQSICIYAINIGAGDNTLLGCRPVTMQNGPPSPTPNPPQEPPRSTRGATRTP